MGPNDLDWRQVGGDIPAFTWVIVQVSGNITGQPNPACGSEPPNWPCQMSPLVTPFQSEPSSIGPVQMVSNVGPRYAALWFRGAGDGGVALYMGRDPSTLAAHLNLNNPLDQNPNPGGQIPSWVNLTGSYSVTATAVPSPLQLTGGSTGDSLGTVTYAVSPLEPLQFSLYDWSTPLGAITWRWVEGDSVPETTVYDGAAWDIESCRYQTSCTWTPPAGKNGRVEAAAWVEGQYAIVRSAQVRETGTCSASLSKVSTGTRYSVSSATCQQEPKLVLECNGVRGSLSVVRATEVTCTPKSDPQGSPVTVTKWQFVGEGYTYPSAEDMAETDPQWKGPMVMSGTITVSGKVASGTTEQSASLSVTVTPRTQVPAQPDLFTVRTGTVEDMDEDRRPHVPPLMDEDLGRIQFRGTVYGSENADLASTYVGQVTDGPNSNLLYLTKVPASYVGIVVLNPQMQRGSDFYRQQAHSDQVVTATCVQERWDHYVQLIFQHEGFPINDHSHAGFFQEKLNQEAWPAVEGIVKPSSGVRGLIAQWQARLRKVFDDANAYSGLVDQQYPVPFGCHFNF